MKQLFAKIALALSLLCFGNAFAEPVTYLVSDGNGRPLVFAVINYKSNGFEATIEGQKLSVEVSANKVVMTMGKIIMTASIDSGGYYHNRVGAWRRTDVTTSTGDKGFARMFYAGMTPSGRLYREELWLNGSRLNRSETVIDHNDQIVWSVMTDAEGTMQLTKK